MKRKSLIATSILLSLLTAACGTNQSTSNSNSKDPKAGTTAPNTATNQAPPAGKAKYEWIAGTAVVKTVAIARATDFFAQRVNELSNGAIHITIHHGGTLGGDRDIVENVKNGSVQIAVPGQTILSGWYKPAEVWIFPNLYNDVQHKDRVWDAIKKEYSDEVAAQTDIRPLLAIPRAPRMLSSNKVIKTPDDLKGLRIRVPETPMWIETFKRYGASPVGMALPEVYSALQTKVIDGQENPIEDSFNTGFFEVNDHLALTRHMMQDNILVINEPLYKSLPDDLKGVLQKASDETEKKFREVVYKEEAEFLQKVKDKGVAVNEVDQEAFRAKVKGMEDNFPYIKKWLDKIREIK